MLVSEVLREYKKEMRIDNKLKEVELINSWEEIAGQAIARRTTKSPPGITASLNWLQRLARM